MKEAPVKRLALFFGVDGPCGQGCFARSVGAVRSLSQTPTLMRLTHLVIAGALLASAVTPANAQFGGLMNKAKAKAREAVQGPAKRAPAPAFDDRVLEITDERVGQLIKGLETERSVMSANTPGGLAAWQQREKAAYAERKRDYATKTAGFQKELAVWEAKAGPVNKCRDAVDRKYASNPRDPRKNKEYDACGDPGVGPARPDVPEPRPPADSPDQQDPVSAGAGAASMTNDQYSTMRERVTYLVSIKADFSKAKSSSGHGFADSEAEAVKKRLPELERLRCVLENPDCK